MTIMNQKNVNQKKAKAGGLFAVGRELAANSVAYAMALPGLMVLIAFSYVPFYYIVTAFQKFNLQAGVFGSQWVGLRNFNFFFGMGGKALQITFNTLLLNALFIIFGVVFQTGIALLVNEINGKLFKKITQTIYFFPYFLSWVVIGQIIYNLLSSENGSINVMLRQIGLEGISFYKHPEYWRTILVLSYLWKATGYGSMVYLATLSGFDTSYYEAAIVDGATRLQCMFRITLPLLKPVILVMTLFSVGRIFFGDFGMVYGVVRDVGPLLQKVEIIDTYVYRSFRQTGNIGMSVAIGLYQSVMGLITIVLSNRVVKQFNEGTALF